MSIHFLQNKLCFGRFLGEADKVTQRNSTFFHSFQTWLVQHLFRVALQLIQLIQFFKLKPKLFNDNFNIIDIIGGNVALEELNQSRSNSSDFPRIISNATQLSLKCLSLSRKGWHICTILSLL